MSLIKFKVDPRELRAAVRRAQTIFQQRITPPEQRFITIQTKPDDSVVIQVSDYGMVFTTPVIGAKAISAGRVRLTCDAALYLAHNSLHPCVDIVWRGEGEECELSNETTDQSVSLNPADQFPKVCEIQPPTDPPLITLPATTLGDWFASLLFMCSPDRKSLGLRTDAKLRDYLYSLGPVKFMLRENIFSVAIVQHCDPITHRSIDGAIALHQTAQILPTGIHSEIGKFTAPYLVPLCRLLRRYKTDVHVWWTEDRLTIHNQRWQFQLAWAGTETPVVSRMSTDGAMEYHIQRDMLHQLLTVAVSKLPRSQGNAKLVFANGHLSAYMCRPPSIPLTKRYNVSDEYGPQHITVNCRQLLRFVEASKCKKQFALYIPVDPVFERIIIRDDVAVSCVYYTDVTAH